MAQNISPARLWAVNALEAVFARGESMDALVEEAAFAAMSPRDRALARAIAGTALRHNGQIDAVLAGFMKKPLPKKATLARAILRCAAAEIVFLRSPSFAVVNDAVNMAARRPQSRPFKALVNAILRKIAAQGGEAVKAIPLTENIPAWLRASWSAAWGAKAVENAAHVLAQQPPADLTVFNGLARDWAETLGGVPLGPQTLRLDGEDRPKGLVPDWPGFAQGAWQVQDAAAALPAMILAPKPGERIADLCAAPGGKSAQLLAAGAQVTCVERSRARLRRLEHNMHRLGFAPDLVCADARTWQPSAPLDAVLLDAPCTSTGVFRRHPDVLVSKTAKQVHSMAAQQMELISAAAAMLRPGGRLVYCVCSAQPEEGAQIVGRAVEELPLKALAIDAALLPYGRAFVQDNALRIPPGAWAQKGGLDAFTMAAFTRA